MPRRDDPRGRRRHRARRQQLANGDVDFAIAWVPKALASREAGRQHRRHRPDLPALGHPAGVASPTRASPRRPTSRARTSATGASATSTRSSPPSAKAGLDPATDVTLVQQQFDMVGLLDGDDRRRRGDDLQRVRPGARGREPRHRRAVHARRLQRHLLRGRRRRHAAGRHLGRRRARSPTTRRTRTSPRGSSPRRSRAGRTAATTPRSAATSSSPPARQLGASHQLWQMNEVNKLIWPSPDGIGIIDAGRVGPHGRDRP